MAAINAEGIEMAKLPLSLLLLFSINIIFLEQVSSQNDDNFLTQAPSKDGQKFAFLPYVYLNVSSGYEVDGIFNRTTIVRSCSTGLFNCLNGNLFKLSWPKACRVFPLDGVWGIGETQSKVVGNFIKQVRHGKAHMIIVATDGVKDRLYILKNGEGLVGIIYDPSNRGILLEEITDDTLTEQLSMGRTKLNNGYVVSYLVGFDTVGECLRV